MAYEHLAIPEEQLKDVVRVIRAGLYVIDVPDEVEMGLKWWCDDVEAYLRARGTDNA